MPRRESQQIELFETSLFLVGGCRVYMQNIRQLVRLLPESEREVAVAIDKNVTEALKQMTRAQVIATELADIIGYKYLRRKEKKKCQK